MLDINITRIAQSNIDQVDFDNLPFGRVFTDHMFIADYNGDKWTDHRIVPLEEMLIHPGNLAWHYGQSIFEGMKATALEDGTPVLFRVEEHSKRMNRSAERMCMPTFSDEDFAEAIKHLVALDANWIPKHKGSALYIRPLMIAMDKTLGVRPSDTYRMIIFCLPVGPYYAKPVSLYAEDHYIRAAKGGVGFAKTAGNYAASLYPARLAKEKGYDQVMWLDAKEFKYVQEVGTMNIFFVINDEIITPETGDTVLQGITRDTVIQILKDKGHQVTERPISIDEILEANENGSLKEIFGSGTAAVIATVSKVYINGNIVELQPTDYTIAPMLKNYIESLKAGEREDTFGWIQTLDVDTILK